MARYLVTGGAGFIGSHLCEALLAAGDSVIVLDDFSTGTSENILGLDGDLLVREASVTDRDAVRAAAANVDGIFHLAALASVAACNEDPVRCHEVNATGTVNVVEAARQHQVKVVYAGSASAYGDPAVVPDAGVPEDMREAPLSPYASAKLAGELHCRAIAAVHGLPVVIPRFFNVYGPKQPPDSPYSGVVAAFCRALLNDDTPTVHGDGEQTRDFTFVADVVRGCILAMATQLEGCPVVNLATGVSHSVRELLDALLQHAGARVEPRFAAARRGDVRHSSADISRARQLLAFQPKVSFEDGLKQTLDWYRSNA